MPLFKKPTSSEKLLELIRAEQTKPGPSEDLPRPEPLERMAGIRWPGMPGLLARLSGSCKGRTFVVGVEFLGRALRMVKIRRTRTGPRLEDLLQHPYAPETNPFAPAFAGFLRAKLREFRCSPASTELWSILPSSQVEILFLRVPKVPRDRLLPAVLFAVRKAHPFNDQEHVLDFEVRGEVPGDGAPRLDIVACLAARQGVERTRQLFRSAGFPLTGLTVAPFAIQNLIRAGWVRPRGRTAANIHVGQDWSRIDIFDRGNLALSRSFVSGMNSMIDALEELSPARQAGSGGPEEPEAGMSEEPPLHAGPARAARSGPAPLHADAPQAAPEDDIDIPDVIPDQFMARFATPAGPTPPLPPDEPDGDIHLLDVIPDLSGGRSQPAPAAPLVLDGEIEFTPLPPEKPAPGPAESASGHRPATPAPALPPEPEQEERAVAEAAKASSSMPPSSPPAPGPAAQAATAPVEASARSETASGEAEPGQREHLRAILIGDATDAAGCASPLERTDELLSSAVKRLIRHVERTFDHYMGTLGREGIEEAFFYGPAAANPKFIECAVGLLGIPGQALDPLGAPFHGIGLRNRLRQPDRLSMAIATGLGLSVDSQAPNFLRPYQDRIVRRRGILAERIGYGATALILVGLLATAAGQMHTRGQSKARLESLERELAAFTPRVTQPLLAQTAAALNAKKQALREAVKKYEGLAVMNEVSALATPTIRLLSLDATFGKPEAAAGAAPQAAPQGQAAPQKPAAGGHEGQGRSVRMEGYVLAGRDQMEGELARFVMRLQQSPLFGTGTRIETKETRRIDPEGDVLYFLVTAPVG